MYTNIQTNVTFKIYLSEYNLTIFHIIKQEALTIQGWPVTDQTKYKLSLHKIPPLVHNKELTVLVYTELCHTFMFPLSKYWLYLNPNLTYFINKNKTKTCVTFDKNTFSVTPHKNPDKVKFFKTYSCIPILLPVIFTLFDWINKQFMKTINYVWTASTQI